MVYLSLVWCYRLTEPDSNRRALSDDEKKCYIDAVKCLHFIPAHDESRPLSWTRFDEFLSTHIEQAIKIHFVVGISAMSLRPLPDLHIKGQFLPWHRLFMKSYENALRNECGYTGAQPYDFFPWER